MHAVAGMQALSPTRFPFQRAPAIAGALVFLLPASCCQKAPDRMLSVIVTVPRSENRASGLLQTLRDIPPYLHDSIRLRSHNLLASGIYSAFQLPRLSFQVGSAVSCEVYRGVFFLF